jgi:PPK2 family polyphosphate:nucleotide phosphotransferase
MTFGDLLRVPTDGEVFSLATIDPRSTPGTDLDKDDAKSELEEVGEELADLQERLWAEGRTGGRRRVLVVLQGMDTSGKGGAVKHVVGQVNPAGVRITGFGAPTKEELEHDFLWRIEKALPQCGGLGVFDRSHYEDVLIARVHDLVPPQEWEARYERINAWEAQLADDGVVLLKVMFHISPEYQRERLLKRLGDPTKFWKLDPSDIDERQHWNAYQLAYEVALSRCSTEVAPWYVVPADRKWYRNWALSRLLLETLQGMDLQWPDAAGLDLEGMRKALDG